MKKIKIYFESISLAKEFCTILSLRNVKYSYMGGILVEIINLPLNIEDLLHSMSDIDLKK